MEEAAFQDYTQKMQEINATLERISLHSLPCPPFRSLDTIPSAFFPGKLESSLAGFLATVENLYQEAFQDGE